MIIAKTPLRISIIGGGTDYPEYYKNFDYGCVISAAIGIYVHVIVKGRYDKDIAVNWSKHERVTCLNDVQHDLVRESMRFLGITEGLEITTISDIDTAGSGLGSSSAVLVGLLHALHAYKGEPNVPADQLAMEAVHIEQEILHKPIGVQDAWPCAVGGFNYFRFWHNGFVYHTPVEFTGDHLMLFKVGACRDADVICAKVGQGAKDNHRQLGLMKHWAELLREYGGSDKTLGVILSNGWELKKQLAEGITNPVVDKVVKKLIELGAIGCKLCGSGASGYVLACAEPSKHDLIVGSVDLQSIPVMVSKGSTIVYNE